MSAEAEFATHWGIGTLLPGDGPADHCRARRRSRRETAGEAAALDVPVTC